MLMVFVTNNAVALVAIPGPPWKCVQNKINKNEIELKHTNVDMRISNVKSTALDSTSLPQNIFFSDNVALAFLVQCEFVYAIFDFIR